MVQGEIFIESRMCFDFVGAALEALADDGVRLAPEQPLGRDFLFVFGDRAEVVDAAGSARARRRVLRFYRALAHAEDQFRRTFAYGQPMLQAIEALQISSFVGVEGSYVRVQVRAPYINYCVGLQPLPPARPRIFVEPGDHECALQLRGFAPPGGSAAQS